MRILVWLFRAALFFALFAFALNNLEDTSVRWFFGFEWRAPMVVVVLVAFTCGCIVGALAMLPGRRRRRADDRAQPHAPTTAPPSETPVSQAPTALAAWSHPPRDGL